MTDYAKKHTWWLDAARLYEKLITRTEATKRGVPRMTSPKYDAELADLRKMALWIHWNYWGRHPPRPAEIWARVPDHAKVILKEYEKAHPKKPPPMPPPPPPPGANPPSRWENAPWTKKHVHLSHGLRKTIDGGQDNGVWTPDQIVALAKQSGCGAVFAQIGDDVPGDPAWAKHCRQLYDAGHAAGIQVGAWGRVDYIGWEHAKACIDAVLPLDGFLADVEGPCHDPLLPEHLVDAYPNLPLGVIATGAIDGAFGTDAIDSAKRFGDNFDFVGQDYAKAGTPLETDPAGHGENFVYWRSTAKVEGGYRHLPDAAGRWHVPVGMSNAEGTPPMSAQVEWFKPYAPHIGWWDAEIIEANGEWGVWASL